MVSYQEGKVRKTQGGFAQTGLLKGTLGDQLNCTYQIIQLPFEHHLRPLCHQIINHIKRFVGAFDGTLPAPNRHPRFVHGCLMLFAM